MKDEGGPASDEFTLRPSAFILSRWPDSGLTRNTRELCYRCSVPGLAGFTKFSVVRSPKPDNLSNFRSPSCDARAFSAIR